MEHHYCQHDTGVVNTSGKFTAGVRNRRGAHLSQDLHWLRTCGDSNAVCLHCVNDTDVIFQMLSTTTVNLESWT
jgi:hypothetical protein